MIKYIVLIPTILYSKNLGENVSYAYTEKITLTSLFIKKLNKFQFKDFVHRIDAIYQDFFAAGLPDYGTLKIQ